MQIKTSWEMKKFIVYNSSPSALLEMSLQDSVKIVTASLEGGTAYNAYEPECGLLVSTTAVAPWA